MVFSLVHKLKPMYSATAAVLAVIAFASLLLLLQQQQRCSAGEGWIAHSATRTNEPLPISPRNVSIAGFKPVECLPSYSRHFHDVLLIMQFSHRLGHKERELLDLYSCFLPNIVQYSCHCNASGVEAGGMHCLHCPPAVTLGSEMQYMFMADAMQKYPNYAGYMFMQEDVVLGFWNYPVRHNKGKVWGSVNFPDPTPRVWHKLQNLSLLDTLQHGAAGGLTNNPTFPFSGFQAYVKGFTLEEQQRMYHRNSVSGSPTFKMANCDMYYIPAKYRQQVVQHFERAAAHIVHMEIAIPAMFDAILPDDGFEVLVGGALSSITDSVQKIALYDPCWDFYHKIKSSRPVEWIWLVETIARYGRMTGMWDCGQLGAEGLTSYARVGQAG